MRHAIWLSITSFALHFLWESIQCPLLYVHGSCDASWLGMIRASLGDVVITWFIFGTVAAVSIRWRWDAERWDSRQWITLICIALVLGVGVELRALATGRWMYEPAMPVVPAVQVGIVPLLQLLVLSPVCFRFAARLAAGPRPRVTRGSSGT